MQDRYRRQKAFVEVGERGQKLLSSARVAICGMGALGAMVAERLCRSGVGYMRLIDRDWVEVDNLPRQALYTTRDAMEVRPKSIAAREHLLAIDPDIVLDAIVEDVTYLNATERLSDVDCIIDGTDNFETRYLINDVSVRFGIPWVHAGIVGASGQSMAFVPGKTACFRCLLPEPPPADQMQTCDSAGVLGAAVGVIASWQAMEAIKILLRKEIAGDGFLRVFDLWSGEVRNVRVPRNLAVGPLDDQLLDDQLLDGQLLDGQLLDGQLLDGQLGCRTCVQNEFDFLNGAAGTHARVLCGRGAVQIQASGNGRIDLAVLSNRLRQEGQVTETPFLVRFSHPPYLVSVFSDGRAIVQGTENPDEARKIYARWIGG